MILAKSCFTNLKLHGWRVNYLLQRQVSDNRNRSRRVLTTFIVAYLLIVLCPNTAYAYIGPGAGFALLSSFLYLLASFFLVFLSFLTWPFRMFLGLFRRQKAYSKAKVGRLVILGFDGLDPELCEQYMSRR